MATRRRSEEDPPSPSEILAISDAWDAVLVANDAGAVAAFMADDWVYVSPTGVTRKADLIEWITSGRLAHHSMRVGRRPRVAVHGDTAVMTARKASSGHLGGKRYTADEWIREVYVREDGRWSCVLSQQVSRWIGTPAVHGFEHEEWDRPRRPPLVGGVAAGTGRRRRARAARARPAGLARRAPGSRPYPAERWPCGSARRLPAQAGIRLRHRRASRR